MQLSRSKITYEGATGDVRDTATAKDRDALYDLHAELAATSAQQASDAAARLEAVIAERGDALVELLSDRTDELAEDRVYGELREALPYDWVVGKGTGLEFLLKDGGSVYVHLDAHNELEVINVTRERAEEVSQYLESWRSLPETLTSEQWADLIATCDAARDPEAALSARPVEEIAAEYRDLHDRLDRLSSGMDAETYHVVSAATFDRSDALALEAAPLADRETFMTLVNAPAHLAANEAAAEEDRTLADVVLDYQILMNEARYLDDHQDIDPWPLEHEGERLAGGEAAFSAALRDAVPLGERDGITVTDADLDAARDLQEQWNPPGPVYSAEVEARVIADIRERLDARSAGVTAEAGMEASSTVTTADRVQARTILVASGVEASDDAVAAKAATIANLRVQRAEQSATLERERASDHAASLSLSM